MNRDGISMRSATTGGRTNGSAPKRHLTRWRTGRVGVSESAVEQGYVEWLQRESMLARGGAVSSQLAGLGSMSQRPFAHSDPRAAIEKASVWFTAYPISMITKRGTSFNGLPLLCATALRDSVNGGRVPCRKTPKPSTDDVVEGLAR